MRHLAPLAVLAIAVCGPVSANPMVTNVPSDPVIIQSPFPAGFNDGPKYTPREWLAKLRRQCKSDDASDRMACNRGLAALKKGHAELLTRRATENTVAD
jgi:hypothetical protein